MLDRALAHYSGRRRKLLLAADLGIGAQWFSRLYNGRSKASLGPEGCFKLANMIGEPPLNVLRAAAKEELATLLDKHYGPRPTLVAPPLDPLLRELVEVLPVAAETDRQWLEKLISMFADGVRQRETSPKPRQPHTRTG